MEDEQAVTRRTVLGTGAAAAAALAGCTGEDTPDESSGGAATATGTPTATATPTGPTLESFEYPEGATRDGIDGETLAETHREAIIDAGSLTLEMEETREFDGHGETSEVTREWGDSGVIVTTDGRLTETLYSPAGERAGYVEMDTGFEQRYRIDNRAPSAESVSQVTRFGHLVTGVAWSEATEVVEDAAGDHAVVYGSTGVADADALQRVVYGEVTDLEASVTVSQAGHVSALSYDITVEQEHSTIREVVEATVTGVAETDVEEPDWMETAKETGTRFDMSLVEDGEVVELEMINGEEVPGDATLSASFGRQFDDAGLPGAVSVGDRVSAAFGSDGELRVRVNATPSETSPLGDYGRVALRFEEYTLFEERIHR